LRSVSIEWKEHPYFTNYLIQNGGIIKNKKTGKILKTRKIKVDVNWLTYAKMDMLKQFTSID
jgi:hypothetical protein